MFNSSSKVVSPKLNYTRMLRCYNARCVVWRRMVIYVFLQICTCQFDLGIFIYSIIQSCLKQNNNVDVISISLK